MATSDLLLKDQSATPASFAPESSDQGTNAAGTTIKRSMFGSNDGALITIGAKADVAATAPGTAAPWSVVALLKAIWVALGSPLQAGGTVTVSNLPATQPVSGVFYQATQPVSAAALPLPAGAATAAGLTQVVTALGTPLQTGGAVSVSNLPTTQAVSATALPLPTGAATAAGVAALVTALGSPVQAGATVPVRVAAVGYATVAASASAQVLGTTGAIGDYLAELLVVPTSTSPGAISVQDGTGTTLSVFVGGSSSISNLVPFTIPLGIASKIGAWKVTTGSGLAVVATGTFT